MFTKLKKLRIFIISAFLIILPLLTKTFPLVAQTKINTILKGVVLDNQNKTPLDGATIILPQYSLWAVTDKDGLFTIDNVPEGQHDIVVRLIGYVTVEKKITVTINTPMLNIRMDQNNLRLNEVEVSARMKKEGITPITSISRSAMDHMQAISLSDVLELLPGAVPTNQSLSSVSTASLNNFLDVNTNGKAGVLQAVNLSSMGTSIIVDNAPLSNNSNLQTLSTATNTSTSFQSSSGTGVDLRQISTDNIESIDVIRGIASVQYGDATSGAIIVRSKAGKSPLNLRFKINPNITQTSISSGYDLGKKNGSLNISFDYANSLNKESEANNSYNRYTAKFLYSNTFFDKLRSNFSLDLIYAKDRNRPDADDSKTGLESHSKNKSFRFNANGSYLINQDWLKSIQYTFSTAYTQLDSYYQNMTSNSENIFSTAMADNSIIGNAPGIIINDENGNQITHWNDIDRNAYTFSTLNSYLASYNVDGREWNTFASLKANFAKDLGITKHKLIIGGDFKSDGNKGKGKTFDIHNPPSTKNSRAIRPRSYKDIPFINILGAYVEENMTLDIAGHALELQAGVRLDKQKDLKAVVTPRINASIEILKDKLFLRGGYGEIVKSAPLLYLYPENAYFDLLNYTDKTINTIDPQYIVTTRVFDTRNYDLELAKNKKAEIGLDFFFGRNSLNITAYKERMKNGYNFYADYRHLMFNKYINSGNSLAYDNDKSREVFVSYNKPMNSMNIETKGFEFNVNIARISAIRTSFVFTGGYTEVKSYDNNQELYIKNDDISSKYLGVYEAGNTKYKRTRFATNLRVVHNIPELGFIVSISAVTTWKNKSHDIIGNDSIPLQYYSLEDKQYHDFNPDVLNDPNLKNEFNKINKQSTLSSNRYMADSFPILWSFNLHLTKEIGRNLSASFFVNNIFSHKPRFRDWKNNKYEIIGQNTFFGVELSAKIPW